MHFNRFRVTAKYFDHVFTTDAGCIRQYLSGAGDRLKTAASLAFYAQPLLHNILPSKRPYEHAVTYAGSYYGEKYPKRSVELSRTVDRRQGLRTCNLRPPTSESRQSLPVPGCTRRICTGRAQLSGHGGRLQSAPCPRQRELGRCISHHVLAKSHGDRGLRRCRCQWHRQGSGRGPERFGPRHQRAGRSRTSHE